MITNSPTPSKTKTRELNFSRYAVAAAALGTAVSAQADFSSPYAITDGTHPAANYSGASATGTFGNWTSSLTYIPVSDSLDTTGAPGSVSLSETSGNNFTADNFDFISSAQGSGQVSFTYNFNLISGSGNFSYLRNGTLTVLTFANANTTGSFMVNAGDTFGFRLSANYNSSNSVAISGFSAPVPEPGVNALVATGAVGLIALREMRRRNKARAAAGTV